MRQAAQGACAWLGSIALRHRFSVLGLVATISFIAIALMGRLTISGEIGDIVGDASAAARAIATIDEKFDAGEALLVLAEASFEVPRPDAERALLEFAESFEVALLADPASDGLVRHVAWREDDSASAWLEEAAIPAAALLLDDAGFAELQSRLTEPCIRARLARIEALLAAPGPLAQTAAAEAVDDPLGVRGLLVDQWRGSIDGRGLQGSALSDDGRAVLIRIMPSRDDMQASKQLVELARRAISDVSHPGIAIELTGSPAIAAYSAQSIRRDLIWSVIGAAIGVQVLFLVAYRGAMTFLIVALPAGIGIVWAFGAMALFDPHVTALSAAIGAILIGLGVDYAIHVTSSARDGDDPERMGLEALVRVAPGLIGAGITSVIGFGVLATSRLEILNAFALIGALGLAFAMMLSIVMLPILIRRTIVPRKAAIASRLIAPRGRALAWLGVSIAIGIGGCVVIGIRGAAGHQVIPLDDRLEAMHPSPHPALDAQQRVSDRFGASGGGVPVLISGADDAELLELAHLVRMSVQGADSELGIRGVVGVDMLVPAPDVIQQRRARFTSIDRASILQAVRRAIDDSILSPDAMEGALERLDVMLSGGDPPSLDDLRQHPDLARSFLAADGSWLALSYVVLDDPVDARGERAAIATGLGRILDDVPGTTVTGLPVLASDAERIVAREAPRLLVMAAVGVVAWLLLFFRNPMDVMLALVPAGFATIIVLALLAPLDIRLNVVNMAGIPLLVGIGVDDGIFLVSAARSRGRDRSSLIGQLDHVSHAIVITSLTTLLAFGSLVFTTTPAIQSLGLLVGLGVAACLWGSLFLLAPLLVLRSDGQGKEMA